MSILKWLGLAGEAPGRASVGDTETVRRIVQELDRLPPADARYIAAFAYILGRVAMADLAISADETQAMERIVTERAACPRSRPSSSCRWPRARTSSSGAQRTSS